MTDRIEALRQAAQARHDATLTRAQNTLRALTDRGETITYTRLARAAGVSRSWLYAQPELRAQIDGTGQRDRAKGSPRSHGQPASSASLRQQLSTYREEIARLRAENKLLNEQLARHLGAQRNKNITNR